MRYFRGGSLVGVDAYEVSLQRARSRGTHDEFVSGDVKRLEDLFPERRFDACVALDVIEHLEKNDGWRMLVAMERLATRRVIIFTPNGFLPQKSHEGDLQAHLSGWAADEMRSRGYLVTGLLGPKWLRGGHHGLTRRPRLFWAIVSLVSHYIVTARSAEKAAAIFCVKNVQKTAL